MSVRFIQLEYPPHLYNTELNRHSENLQEYKHEVLSTLINSINLNRPNLELYQQQPYLTFAIRTKLIDFLLKMSIRLKILPFVFFRAVKIFDRYCSKRVVLLDQSQLIITTCLWIASKIQGGNNHFVNLSNVGKLADIKTITDLGYGSGGRFLGPTERFRLPKLHELVKLCGAKCKYDQGMFKQMEIHVLTTLEWSLNDPSVEEFLVSSKEFNICPNRDRDETIVNEIFKVKEYLSYISLYSNELIDCDVIDLSKGICALTNEMLNLGEDDCYYQRINFMSLNDDSSEDFFYEEVNSLPLPIKHSPSKLSTHAVKQHLIAAVTNSSEFIIKLFELAGPQQVYNTINNKSNNKQQGEYYQHPRYQFTGGVLTPSSPLRNTHNNTASSSPLRPSPTSSLPQPPLRKRPTTNNSNNHNHNNIISSSAYKKPLPAINSEIINNNNHGNNKNYIPAPHQLPTNFNAFNALADSMYEPCVLPSVLLKFNNNQGLNDLTPQTTKIPNLITAHNHQAHNNSSQASLYSQCSSRNDHGSIFDSESVSNPASCHVGTPLSEDNSPLFPMIKSKQFI